MIHPRRLTALTKKVISINSENPPGNELVLAKFIEWDMKSLRIDVRTYTYVKGRPNVIAILKGSWPRSKAKREAILITPHFDTVPIGKGWKHNPLGQITKGKIYGRGATDDKGNLACCMEVMRSLVEDNAVLKRDVILAATVDEETGSHQGIIPLLEKKILKPKVAVILDSDEFDTIVAQKGLIHCRIQITGKKAHGAYNWQGINAIEQAARIILKLKKYKPGYKRHKLLHAPTLNVGVIKGGDKVNMVADQCEFSVDFRFMPGMNAKEIVRDFKRIVATETRRFKIIIDDVQQPYEIDSRLPLVDVYTQSAHKYKVKALIKGSEGATAITFFKKYRIPAFATGFGAADTAHTTDEYAVINTLCKGAKILEQYIKDYDALMS